MPVLFQAFESHVIRTSDSNWTVSSTNDRFKTQSRRSTNVFSVIRYSQFGHRANSPKMNSYGPRLPVTSVSNQSKGISESWGDDLLLGPTKSVRTDRNQVYLLY